MKPGKSWSPPVLPFRPYTEAQANGIAEALEVVIDSPALERVVRAAAIYVDTHEAIDAPPGHENFAGQRIKIADRLAKFRDRARKLVEAINALPPQARRKLDPLDLESLQSLATLGRVKAEAAINETAAGRRARPRHRARKALLSACQEAWETNHETRGEITSRDQATGHFHSAYRVFLRAVCDPLPDLSALSDDALQDATRHRKK
ncbi:MAG TPA: hypothetical protein VM325_17215 [Alphaproteobacteria bacterium]|nr:hypothetical protein [Alphaproteobacteria bacterium]